MNAPNLEQQSYIQAGTVTSR